MRRTVALAIALTCGLLSSGPPASAGITYEMIFRSTGTDEVEFPSVAEARAANVVTDLIMTTTDALIINSISVGWDDSKGLEVAQARKWSGLDIPGGFYTADLGGPVQCDNAADQCILFTGSVPPPNGPPSLQPGTYNIGTVIWDTSAILSGVSSVFPFVFPGLDATGAVLPPASNNIVDVTGIEQLIPGAITVIPEPASAALVALGLLGVALAGRRRTSE